MMFKMELTRLVIMFGCLVGVTKQSSQPALTRCSAPVDVSFLIDCSNSIWNPNFETQINFVQDIVGQFEIGPDKIQVAVITFANETKIQFNFGELATTEAVIERVGEITQDLGELTNTQDALKMMQTSLFSSKSARRGVPKIGILLTDGQAQEHEETLRQAMEAKKAGIKLMVIGIGNDKNLRYDEIYEIASYPLDENVHIRDTFDDLHDVDFKELIGSQFCLIAKRCYVPLDVAFLIDGSRSIWPPDFDTQISFVQSLVKLFDIGPDATHVSALTFSDVITPLFYLSESTSQKEILEMVGNVEQDLGDHTFTHEALREMRTQLFAPSKGARDDVKHVCIILTDGNATMQEETLDEADLVLSEDIWVIAIGIGEYLNKADLMAIVSQPTDKNVFFQNTYDKLKSANFQELVSRQACPTARRV